MFSTADFETYIKYDGSFLKCKSTCEKKSEHRKTQIRAAKAMVESSPHHGECCFGVQMANVAFIAMSMELCDVQAGPLPSGLQFAVSGLRSPLF
jgi:hypothetical protein